MAAAGRVPQCDRARAVLPFMRKKVEARELMVAW